MVRLPSSELAGYVQATIYTSGAAYIGYEFSSKHWRQGIGRASLLLMLAELNTHYGVHTFVAVLKSANYRSLGLLQKLGFVPGTQEDAVLYEAETDETTLTMPASRLGRVTDGGNAA